MLSVATPYPGLYTAHCFWRFRCLQQVLTFHLSALIGCDNMFGSCLLCEESFCNCISFFMWISLGL